MASKAFTGSSAMPPDQETPRGPVIENALRRTVSGIVRGDAVSWELGRKCGPSIGM